MTHHSLKQNMYLGSFKRPKKKTEILGRKEKKETECEKWSLCGETRNGYGWWWRKIDRGWKWKEANEWRGFKSLSWVHPTLLFLVFGSKYTLKLFGFGFGFSRMDHADYWDLKLGFGAQIDKPLEIGSTATSDLKIYIQLYSRILSTEKEKKKKKEFTNLNFVLWIFLCI